MQNIYYKKQNFSNEAGFMIFRALGILPSFLLISSISVYQCILSPDHGIVSLYTIGKCKFRPTCSEYTKVMIKKYGAIIGVKRGFKQLRQCH